MNQQISSLAQPHSTTWLRPMVRTMCCIAVLFGMSTYMVQAQINTGSIMGYVYDQESKKAVRVTQVLVQQNGQLITRGSTDLQGFFFFPDLKPDTNYVVIFSPMNHRAVRIPHCEVRVGHATLIELKVQLTSDTLTPLIVNDRPSTFISGQLSSAIRYREYSKSYLREGVQDNDGQVGSVRGIRDASTDIYIDGVKVRGYGIKQPAEPMPPILNGTPATEAQPAATAPQ